MFTTVFFYCSDPDPQRNDCISIYRGILSQLLGKCPELIPYCYEKSQTSGELNLITTRLAEQLLKLFFERIARLYIVIDGLDECDLPQRKLVLSFFTAIVAHCDDYDPGKLRIRGPCVQKPRLSRRCPRRRLSPVAVCRHGLADLIVRRRLPAPIEGWPL